MTTPVVDEFDLPCGCFLRITADGGVDHMTCAEHLPSIDVIRSFMSHARTRTQRLPYVQIIKDHIRSQPLS